MANIIKKLNTRNNEDQCLMSRERQRDHQIKQAEKLVLEKIIDKKERRTIPWHKSLRVKNYNEK